MQYKTAAIFAVGLASSAAATGWLDQDGYSVPSNTDNKCSEQQQGGYDWSGLSEGSFSSYGSNSFSGFSCGNSYGKRDLLTKRTFQSKCIQGSLDEKPSMSCDSDDDKMSIDEMEISTSEDADVECEYSMPDGSLCRETHSCSSGGNVVKNSQCGGARSVTFKPGKNAPSGCSVGVHSIGFNCNPAPSSYPAVSSTVATPGYTSKTSYTTSSAACAYGDYECSASATPSSPVSESAPAPSCAYGEEGCEEATSSAPATTATPGYTQCAYGEECDSSAVPSSSSTEYSPVESTSSAPACGGYGQPSCEESTVATPGYTQGSSSSTEYSPVESTSEAWTPPSYGGETSSVPEISSYVVSTSSTPSSPETSSQPEIPSYGVSTSSTPASPETSSKPEISSYGTGSISTPVSPETSSAPYPTKSTQGIPGYGTGSASVSSSTEYSPVESSSVPAYPEPSCPGVLPKCLKTWLHVSECKDSADSDCFCKNAEFIKNVHQCLPAWADNEEASAAASYLMGLCAPHVPENPGIITNCPSTITPVVTPTKSASSSPIESAPVSSIPVYSQSSSTEYSPVESSPIESAPVESEAPPAYTPKTHTYWSTAEVTITSCGPEVTDCPAGSTVVQTTSTPVVSVETTPIETTPAAETPYSPEQPSEGAPPAYGSPSAPAEVPASTPYSPVESSAGSPPAYAPSASTPYSPVTESAEAPAEYPTEAASSPVAPGYTTPPAETAPMTTISISSTMEVPATYTEGVSQGYEIPESSSTTTLVTTITVPQVQMTTVTLTGADGQPTQSVGLGAGSPAPADATPTADAVGGDAPAGYGTGSAGFGTSYIPKPTGTAPIEQVGNSGVKVGSSLAGLALGAVAALMAL